MTVIEIIGIALSVIKYAFFIGGFIAIVCLLLAILSPVIGFILEKIGQKIEAENLKQLRIKNELNNILEDEKNELNNKLRNEEDLKKLNNPDFTRFFPKPSSESYLYVIDSNIWMDKKWSLFFYFLTQRLFEKKITISMHSIQYDEINNLQSKEASLAKKRILEMIQTGVLRIDDILVESNRHAYFDKYLISKIVDEKKLKTIELITKDRDLKIRILSLWNCCNGERTLEVIDPEAIEEELNILEAIQHRQR